jgi:hypothetical protein
MQLEQIKIAPPWTEGAIIFGASSLSESNTSGWKTPIRTAKSAKNAKFKGFFLAIFACFALKM